MITTLWHFLIFCLMWYHPVQSIYSIQYPECVLTAVIITHCTWSPVHSSAGLTLHCALVTSGDKVWTCWGGGTGHRYWAASLKVALTPVQVSSLLVVVTRPGWQCGPYWHRTQNTEQQDPASRSGGSAAPARSLDTIADPPHSNTNTSRCLNRQTQY